MEFLWSLIINTLAFVLIAKTMPGFRVRDNGTAFLVALIYGIVIALANILLSPLLLMGFGGGADLAAATHSWTEAAIQFAVGFVVSVAALILTDKLVDDFRMADMPTAMIAALLLGLIQGIFGFIF